MQIELGAQVMVSTVVIGALQNNTSKDTNEFLSMTNEEASWFGEYIKNNTLLNNKTHTYGRPTLL